MKHNWEYKQLIEIGQIVTGSTPATSVDEYYSSSDYMFVKPGDIEDNKISILNDSEVYISKIAFESVARKLPKDSILVTCIGTIGKVGILSVDATCNQQINAIIPNKNVLSKYIAYSILSIRAELNSRKNGPVVPIINKTQFSTFSIPVPPLAEQERIVAELDALNGTIAKCRELLATLDSLAQSLFYDTFGDPVTNPKGWSVRQFEDNIIKIKYPSKLQTKEYLQDGKYPIVSQEDCLISGYTNREDCLFFTSKPIVIFGDHTRCIKYIDFTFALGADGVKILNPKDDINTRFLFYALKLSNIPSLGYSRHYRLLKELYLLVPPLALQESFARKIETIEAEKKKVEATMAEVQRLLDSRMDYWFN